MSFALNKYRKQIGFYLSLYHNNDILKKQVTDALSKVLLPDSGQDLLSAKALTNVQVFGNEVVVDIEISNPSLQYKKKVEVDCLKAIHQHVYEKADVKVNMHVSTTEKTVNKIRGKAIQGVKNIIAIASGKGGVGKSITANLFVALADKGYKIVGRCLLTALYAYVRCGKRQATRKKRWQTSYFASKLRVNCFL